MIFHWGGGAAFCSHGRLRLLQTNMEVLLGLTSCRGWEVSPDPEGPSGSGLTSDPEGPGVRRARQKPGTETEDDLSEGTTRSF